MAIFGIAKILFKEKKFNGYLNGLFQTTKKLLILSK